LFYLDFDNECIVDKKTAKQRNGSQLGDEDAEGKLHPVLLN